MPYILAPPFVEGQTPTNITWTPNTNYTPQPGEVFLTEATYNAALDPDYGPGVWDATQQTLRLRTTAEKLVIEKRRKKARFTLQLVQDQRNLYSEISSLPDAPGEAWLVEAIIELVTNNNATRRKALADVVAKRKRAYANVDNQTTIEAVQALDWSAQ